jgi:Gluconate 2-dehydrogenase subunit 3
MRRPGRGLDRRTFLQAAAVLAAGAAAPFAPVRRAWARSRRGLGFFTDAERATLAALCDRILPPDSDPGAAGLGAPAYIERLLTALDGIRPRIFAGGPYSGRHPFPDLRNGTPSARRPPNWFRRPAPLSLLQQLYWRAELFGGEAAGLPPHLEQQRLGHLRGLRDIYREGLANLDQAAVEAGGVPFAELAPPAQDDLLMRLDAPGALPKEPVRGATFLDLVIRHTLEGCLAAPEYGGNRGGAGWRMVGIEGDSQPLGYSLYSEHLGAYRERPDHPMSTPNPDELAPDGSLAPRPLTPDGAFIQDQISELTSFIEMAAPGACL